MKLIGRPRRVRERGRNPKNYFVSGFINNPLDLTRVLALTPVANGLLLTSGDPIQAHVRAATAEADGPFRVKTIQKKPFNNEIPGSYSSIYLEGLV